MRLGIDIGTCNSCCYVVHGDAPPEAVVSNMGEHTVPSMVAFTEKTQLIGTAARLQQLSNPDNTIGEFKRIIGRKFTDRELWRYAKNWSTSLTECGDNDVGFRVRHLGKTRILRALDLYQIMIEHFIDQAHRQCGRDQVLTELTITVPAHFNHQQRDCVKRCAAASAGNAVNAVNAVPNISLLNEPTAAALAYLNRRGSQMGDQATMIVFDMGAGTLDITALKRSNSEFRILGNIGRDQMGGSVLDDLLLDLLVKYAKTTKHRNLRADSRLLAQAKRSCEDAKKILSVAEATSITVDNVTMPLTRVDFEKIIGSEIRRVSQAVYDLLEDIELEPEEIDAVVMVGGGSRVPALRTMLEAIFEPDRIKADINADECVAMGAAYFQRADICDMTEFAERKTEPAEPAEPIHDRPTEHTTHDTTKIESTKIESRIKIIDVVPVALGVKTRGKIFSLMIPKNTPLPATYEQVFYPAKANQTFANIEVYQAANYRENDTPIKTTDCVCIDKLCLTGLTVSSKITICFTINTDGMLEIRASSDQVSISAKTMVSY